ncbi:MAG: aldehyde dehydrogenase family protein, partial [Pseudomonadota bacterium]|nr:aldehyde dehydrogenase family protein [Pseudomonadota bacterium]
MPSDPTLMKIINPATGALIRELETDTPASVKRKFRAARFAQPAWAALPLGRRIDTVVAFRQRLESEQEILARTLTDEVGKP